MDQKDKIDLLKRFLRGSISEEEYSILRDWLKEPDFEDEFFIYYQQCFHAAPNVMDKTIKDDMLAFILSKIQNPSLVKDKISVKSNKYFSFVRYIAAASVVLLAGIGSYFLGRNSSAGTDQGVVTMSVDYGQKADITLVDGTRISVNSNSRISYDNLYNKKDRKLFLDGEAYFDVAKDKRRPFIVKVNGINIEALGTSFNVRARSKDKSVSVVLVEGRVKVRDRDQEKILNPSERLEYNLTTRKFTKTELYPNTNYLLWQSKELAFYGDSLEEICNNLTQMYDCNFIFKSDFVKHYTFNGTIKNNSLENVLDFISQTASIKYKMISDKTIVIY